jgi:peptidoglycan-associated lipoprotein
MRTYTALALLLPAALIGCATQKTLDTQTEAANQQIDTMKQAYERLAGAQHSLEARLAQLESEQALIASRLNQGGEANAASAREMDTLRAEALATQAALSALTGKVDSQAAQQAQIASRLDRNDATSATLTHEMDALRADASKAQETANDAVKIARDSRLVSGKVVDSLLLNDSMVLYSYEQPELTAEGRAAVDKLIANVRPMLPHVFVEIIGYTDSLSLDSQNRRIALERAESVRRYLHKIGGIPLDRMSTISYGDANPVVSNTSIEGRSQNRRVLVQVLK